MRFMMPVVLPDINEETEKRGGAGTGEWVVIVYNNDHNTYPEVIGILMRATGCHRQEAEIEAWEIDILGRSVVHHATETECNRVASVIRTIGIQVEVREE